MVSRVWFSEFVQLENATIVAGNAKTMAISLLHTSCSEFGSKAFCIRLYFEYTVRHLSQMLGPTNSFNPSIYLSIVHSVCVCVLSSQCSNCMHIFFNHHSLALSFAHSFRKSTQLFSESRVMSFLIAQWNTWTLNTFSTIERQNERKKATEERKRVYRAAVHREIIVN